MTAKPVRPQKPHRRKRGAAQIDPGHGKPDARRDEARQANLSRQVPRRGGHSPNTGTRRGSQR